MKILLLTNKVPYPANDGSSIAMASMIDALLKNGTQLTVLSLNTRKHFKSERDINSELPPGLDFHYVEADTNIKATGAALNLIAGSPYHVSRFYQKAFAKKLTELLNARQYDLVQVEGLSMVIYYELIKLHSTAPITLRAHNVEHQIWERHIANQTDFFQRTYLKIQVKRLRQFELQALSKVDAVVAITPEDEENIYRLNPLARCISIPCGIDLGKSRICEVPKKYGSDIGYLASFDWMPNVQGVEWFLKEVWPMVVKQWPEASFKLGGRHMPDTFKTMNVPGITVVPDVPDMREFVCESRIMVIPLLAGSGMRIKIIENMALGKCQVSTSIGAEGVICKNGRDVLIGNSPEEFASAIIKALESDELRTLIEKNARTNIETHYGNAQLGKSLLTFYKEQLC